MSFLGRGFSSYDSSVLTGGASARGISGRRPSQDTDPERDPYIGMHAISVTRSASRPHTRDGEQIVEEHEPMPLPPDEEDARREAEVHELARKWTQHSTVSEIEANPLEAGPESKLNPASANFSAKAWAKAMLNLQQKDPENNLVRTAGVAFRNLNVYGFGVDTDYQTTVSSAALKAFGFLKQKISGKKRRIDILHNFEGIVHPGEMLVVLGPPGSGCTTFLKTISGETHGFWVDKGSYLNYQGMLSLCAARPL